MQAGRITGLRNNNPIKDWVALGFLNGGFICISIALYYWIRAVRLQYYSLWSVNHGYLAFLGGLAYSRIVTNSGIYYFPLYQYSSLMSPLLFWSQFIVPFLVGSAAAHSRIAKIGLLAYLVTMINFDFLWTSGILGSYFPSFLSSMENAGSFLSNMLAAADLNPTLTPIIGIVDNGSEIEITCILSIIGIILLTFPLWKPIKMISYLVRFFLAESLCILPLGAEIYFLDRSELGITVAQGLADQVSFIRTITNEVVFFATLSVFFASFVASRYLKIKKSASMPDIGKR